MQLSMFPFGNSGRPSVARQPPALLHLHAEQSLALQAGSGALRRERETGGFVRLESGFKIIKL